MKALVLLTLSMHAGIQELALPPEVELSGFTGIEASAFEDLFGRPVLIEFFAHWCAPCARQVPHLNELQERYSERGLVILGVTSDARADAEAWSAQHGMAFPYAYDPGLRLQIDLGFHALPFALLLDPTGAVVWSGKADQLDDETLERSLVGAIEAPVWNWPASASGVRKELANRRYAAALEGLEAPELAGYGKLREEIAGVVSRLIESRAALAEAALERGDLLGAFDISNELFSATVGLPARERFETLLGTIEEDASGVLEAQTELRELWRTVHEVSSKEGADTLLAEIRALSEAYPDTYAQVQATRYEAALGNLRMTLR